MGNDINEGFFLGGIQSGREQTANRLLNERQVDQQQSQFEQGNIIDEINKIDADIRQNTVDAVEFIKGARGRQGADKLVGVAMDAHIKLKNRRRSLSGQPPLSEEEIQGEIGALSSQLQTVETQGEAFDRETQQGIGRAKQEIASGVRADPTSKAPIEFVQIQNARDEALASGNIRRATELQDLIEKKTAESKGQTINVNTAGSAFLKEGGKLRAEALFEKRLNASDAFKSLNAGKEAKDLLDAGIISGKAANFRLEFGKALQLAGVSLADDEIANTEAFVAQRAAEVGRIIKQFGAGTGLSDADREFATKAAGGSIQMTEPSIRRILRINNEVSTEAIELYNNDLSSIPEDSRDALFLKPIDVPTGEIPSDGSEPFPGFNLLSKEEQEEVRRLSGEGG